MREKIICNCGKEMEYEGLETIVLLDDDINNPVVSDAEVFLCPECENKLWIHKVENSKSYKETEINSHKIAFCGEI
jgi:hypothetical protein